MSTNLLIDWLIFLNKARYPGSQDAEVCREYMISYGIFWSHSYREFLVKYLGFFFISQGVIIDLTGNFNYKKSELPGNFMGFSKPGPVSETLTPVATSCTYSTVLYRKLDISTQYTRHKYWFHGFHIRGITINSLK